jgi:hypothetical protein
MNFDLETGKEYTGGGNNARFRGELIGGPNNDLGAVNGRNSLIQNGARVSREPYQGYNNTNKIQNNSGQFSPQMIMEEGLKNRHNLELHQNYNNNNNTLNNKNNLYNYDPSQNANTFLKNINSAPKESRFSNSRHSNRDNSGAESGSSKFFSNPPLQNNLQGKTPNCEMKNDVSLQEINREVHETKRMVINILNNYTDLQSKFIEYNKIIHEQENIIRLNNLKLNEHDSKLTEILFSFNNYLQLNDKTSKIINDLNNKNEEKLNKTEFIEFKANFYTINKNNEVKITENLNKISNIDLKVQDLNKEQELFQKYTLDKLKLYQNEASENKLAQQQQLIKYEESRDNKINAQFEQLKHSIKIIEKNIMEESSIRKNMIENSENILLKNLEKKDEQIKNLSLNTLEIEKKFINFNKDYMSAFQELIYKNNQKIDIENKTLKSILESGILQINLKLQENNKILKLDYENLKNNIIRIETEVKGVDKYMKETLANFASENLEYNSKCNNIDEKLQKLDKHYKDFTQEYLTLVDTKLYNFFNPFEERINKNITDFEFNTGEWKTSHFHLIQDLNEKYDYLNKTISEFILNKNEIKNPTETSCSPVDLVLLEKKINDKILDINQEMVNFEKKIIILINMHIDTFKKNFNDEQKKMTDLLSEKMESKISVLHKEVQEGFKDDFLIKEGRLQEYVIESEERLNKIYHQRFNKIQEDIENINYKISPVGENEILRWGN